jgi:hypothetical protein
MNFNEFTHNAPDNALGRIFIYLFNFSLDKITEMKYDQNNNKKKK